MHHDGWYIWKKKLKAYTHLIVCSRTLTKPEVVAAWGDPNWMEGAFWTYIIDMKGNIVHSFSNPYLVMALASSPSHFLREFSL